MKSCKFLVISSVAVALFHVNSPARAAVIYQTNTFSDLNINAAQTFNWNQFNTGLGTLTGINFIFTNSEFSGSFTVYNNTNSSLTVDDSAAWLTNSWNGVGGPLDYSSPIIDPIITSPNSTNTVVDGLTNTTFNLIAGSNNIPAYDTNLFAFAAYFTGGGTVSNTLTPKGSISTTGANYTVDSSSTLADGTLILAYTYTTGAPVPEASTLGAGALLVALAGYVHRRRRAKTA